MRRTSFWVSFLFVGGGVLAFASNSEVSAHELRTKKTNKIIKHTHYSKGGHATNENGTGSAGTPPKPVPDEFHKHRRCWLSGNVIRQVYGRTRDLTTAEVTDETKALTPEQLRVLKQKMEQTWAILLGPNWRNTVTQVKDTVGYNSNCGGAAFGNDHGWIDPSDWNDILNDDYDLLPGGALPSATMGDIIVYRDHTGRIKHVAKVISTSPLRVRSRIAEYGTWEHPYDVHPPDWTEGGGTRQLYRPKP